MHPEYWIERWKEGRIGFHRAGVNPQLVEHHARALGETKRVLVPLCGKSEDLAWLAASGHEVVVGRCEGAYDRAALTRFYS